MVSFECILRGNSGFRFGHCYYLTAFVELKQPVAATERPFVQMSIVNLPMCAEPVYWRRMDPQIKEFFHLRLAGSQSWMFPERRKGRKSLGRCASVQQRRKYTHLADQCRMLKIQRTVSDGLVPLKRPKIWNFISYCKAQEDMLSFLLCT